MAGLVCLTLCHGDHASDMYLCMVLSTLVQTREACCSLPVTLLAVHRPSLQGQTKSGPVLGLQLLPPGECVCCPSSFPQAASAACKA